MADMTYGNAHVQDRRDDTTYLAAVMKRTSWGAIVAGAVAAIGLQMLLTLLGIAIGITAADVSSDPYTRVRTGVQVAAAAWWLATGTLSLFLGGCIVGRFAGITRSPDVLLHGFTMWAATALFGFLAVTSGAGALYGTAMNATYDGSRASEVGSNMLPRDVRVEGQSTGAGAAVGTRGAAGDVRNGTSDPNDRTVISATDAQRYVKAASWWSLLGLALGISASLAGSWTAAPNRIVVRPSSVDAHA